MIRRNDALERRRLVRTRVAKPFALPTLLLTLTVLPSALAQTGSTIAPPPPPEPSLGALAPAARDLGRFEIQGSLGAPSPAPRSRVGPFVPVMDQTIEGIDFDADAARNGVYQIPPDPIGAAGPNHVVSVVNSTIEWYTKAGAREASTGLVSFFAPLSPPNRGFDPKVIYDQHAGRFVVVALERRDTAQGDPVNSSRILVAVSDDSNPNGTWYSMAINSFVTIGAFNTWADFPGLAVDEEAVYITANMFNFGSSPGFRGERLWILDKAGLYSGFGGTFSINDPFGSVGQAPGTTAMPAHVFGASGVGPGVGTFLVSAGWTSGGAIDLLSVIRVDNPLTAPSFSNQFITLGDITTSFGLPAAPQLGTSTGIDAGDVRIRNALWRNDSLYAANAVLPPPGPDAGQSTAHWYRIDTSTLSSLALADQGNIGGEDIAPGAHTFYASIAVDGTGNIGVGFAASAPTIYPGAYYTGRLASDPPGTVQPSGILADGLDYYVRTFGGSRNRWGDYSGISIDPFDDRTFWVYNEYALARGTVFGGEDGRWGTRWGRFLMIAADLSLVNSALPDPLTRGNDLTYTIAVQNTGPTTASAVTVTDNLPPTTTFVSCSSTGGGVCGGAGNSRTVTFAALAPGASETVTIVARVLCSVPSGTLITDTASVSSSVGDPDLLDNSSTATATALGFEICNGLDDDCDGTVDNFATSCGVGQCASTGSCTGGVDSCAPGSASPEVCDGLDNDCDGTVDDGNPGGGAPCNTGQLGVCAAGTILCSNGSLVCNRNVPPSAEVCNGLDDDCDGSVDEGNPGGGVSCNTGQLGVCAAGTTACSNGSLVCNRNVSPSAEICNNLDDNCDGSVDEGNPGGGASCNTGQFGVCAPGTRTCSNGNLVCRRNVQPSPEVCDGLDNDCDHLVDEGNPGGGVSCNTGQLGVCAPGTTACSNGTLACNRNVAPSAEICDGLDNDCDGVADNHIAAPAGSTVLAVHQSSVTWSPLGSATTYDVVRGSLETLRSSQGDFTVATTGCVASGTPLTSAPFSSSPGGGGQGFWLLVRGRNCGGPGTYDSGAPSQAGLRDAEIQASALKCP